jgi:hypothetical protein
MLPLGYVCAVRLQLTVVVMGCFHVPIGHTVFLFSFDPFVVAFLCILEKKNILSLADIVSLSK